MCESAGRLTRDDNRRVNVPRAPRVAPVREEARALPAAVVAEGGDGGAEVVGVVTGTSRAVGSVAGVLGGERQAHVGAAPRPAASAALPQARTTLVAGGAQETAAAARVVVAGPVKADATSGPSVLSRAVSALAGAVRGADHSATGRPAQAAEPPVSEERRGQVLLEAKKRQVVQVLRSAQGEERKNKGGNKERAYQERVLAQLASALGVGIGELGSRNRRQREAVRLAADVRSLLGNDEAGGIMPRFIGEAKIE